MSEEKNCQKVLITGGSRGIGRGIAHTLNLEGYRVIAIGKSEKAELSSHTSIAHSIWKKTTAEVSNLEP
mgnify:CR=1 FL=1